MGHKKGGNKKGYEAYKANHTREKNKIRKLRTYLKTHQNDQVGAKRLADLEALYKV